MRNCNRHPRSGLMRGMGLAFALVLLNLLLALAIAAMHHYLQAKSVAGSAVRQRNLHLMAQAAYALSSESSDIDGDGTVESPAMNIASPSPSDGGEIAATSGAPRTDAWGTPYGYCAWDNGTTNSSTNRLTGDNPGSDSSIVFALVSAGPDRQFATTCANVKAGTVNGDDIAKTYTVAQLRQGLPRNAWQGVPVTNGTALSALTTSGMLKGQMRVQNDTDVLMSWAGSSWSEVITNGGAGGVTLYNRLKNYFINGDMMVTQRGTTFTANVPGAGSQTVKTADHWRVSIVTDDSGGINATIYIYNSYNNGGNWPTSIQFIDLVPGTFWNDPNTYASLEQPIEGVARLAGKTLTLSMYSEEGYADATDEVWVTQNFGTGGSPTAPITTKVGTISVPYWWGRTSVTFTMPAIPAGTVFGTNGDDYTLISIRDYSGDNNYYTLLQLEDGSQATAYEYLNTGLELALCQRYYQMSSASTVTTENYATYYFPVTGTLTRQIKFRIPMRAAPTVTPAITSSGGTVTASNITANGFTASQTVGTAGVETSSIIWKADADW